jgi:hypothetical protein
LALALAESINQWKFHVRSPKTSFPQGMPNLTNEE